MTESFLSTKPIPARDRLIFAMDVSSLDEARNWVERLGDSVHFYWLAIITN
jgi:orotidine-5'-phosphate decarboxylase